MIASRSILEACDHHIENPESESKRLPTTFPQKSGETIYIHPTALTNFAKDYLPNVKFFFVLVSGDSDMTIPDDNMAICQHILKHPLLLYWFAQNCTKPSQKLKQLPIGLDFHTMAKSNHSWGPMTPRELQEHEVNTLRRLNVVKTNTCYSNFHFLINTRYANDRRDAMIKIPKELIYYEPKRIDRVNSWHHMINHTFVVSPHGNGLDCHRTWEALALGCIPIIKTSPLDPMFDGLPVLIVKEWSDINEELLKSKIVGNMEKLDLLYWLNLIKVSMWCPTDKNTFLKSKEGQITPDSRVGKILMQYIKDVKNIVEIGTWNGLGSTRCFLRSLNPLSNFFTLETNLEKFEIAKKNLESEMKPNATFLWGSILCPEDLNNIKTIFPEVINEPFKGWHAVDINNISKSPNVLDKLPESIDFLLLDGGEFTTWYEFNILFPRCTRYIALDDVNVSKCKMIRHLLKKNPEWSEIEYITERNGFSLFKHN